MTIQDLGSIGELIAAIATLATLVYLAAQIRQNMRAIMATSFMGSQHFFAEILIGFVHQRGSRQRSSSIHFPWWRAVTLTSVCPNCDDT